MALFELLQGVYEDIDGVRHEVPPPEKDENGNFIEHERVIVQSDGDLVKAFGPYKFRRVSPNETTFLLPAKKGPGQDGLPEPSPGSAGLSTERDVSKAAKNGATALAESPGTDVTEMYPTAKSAGLNLWRTKNHRFIVTDAENDEVLTENGPLTKMSLVEFIKEYTG